MTRFLFVCLSLVLALPALAEEPPETVATPTGDSRMPASPTFRLGNPGLDRKDVKVTLYGFVEADTIFDTTQSFVDLQGNTVIAKQGTEAGDNSRFQLGARNSRLGLKVESPALDGGQIAAMGNLEMDFLGVAGGTAESNLYSTPTFRMRHGYVKLTTPAIDVLAGQTWTVLGASATFTPATVDIQGVPGEIYQRTLQLRLGKTINAGDFFADLEVALLRPYQRDSGLPDFGGFLRIGWNGWRGYKATGSTGGDDSGVQLAFSTLARRFRALSPTAMTTSDFETASGIVAIAFDAIIPLIPGSKSQRNNALTFVGEFSTGSGYNDLFTSWNAGVSAVGTPAGASATYKLGPGLDPGVAGFDKNSGALATIDATSAIVSLQYFLPVDNGAVFISALYSTLRSDNAVNFAGTANAAGTVTFAPGAAITEENYFGLDLFWDVTAAARLGLSYGKTYQDFGDGSATRTNERVQLSAYYVF